MWQVRSKLEVSGWTKVTLAVSFLESLRGKRRYVEAGRVLLDYGRDVEAAVGALVEGTAFAEAIRLVGSISSLQHLKTDLDPQTTLYTRRDLIETHVRPGTLEMQSRMLEDIAEVMEQVEKQVERLGELREKRDSNPSTSFLLTPRNFADGLVGTRSVLLHRRPDFGVRQR